MILRNHAALGAYRRYQPRWERVADDLAHRLSRKLTCQETCRCEDRLYLRVYDEAKRRSRGDT